MSANQEPTPIAPRSVTVSVADRLSLLSILPKEGDITSLRLIRTLREDLAIEGDEAEGIGLKVEGGNFTWDKTKERPKSIELSRQAWKLVEGVIEKLNQQKKLGLNCLGLYEKFCEESS